MTVQNLLFIMADQLRADYLSCYGHPTLHTPHLDWLAAQGVRFTRASCASPICGPSRMSFYTGRYAQSHGATWNGIPLRPGEWTLGDFLRPHGRDTWLVGKTHFYPDLPELQRLRVDLASPQGKRLLECGFEVFDRMEGLYPEGPAGRYNPERSAYEAYLNAQGYPGKNPWNDWANSAEGPQGELLEGWYMRHAHRPARVQEAHSETAYTTDQAIAFLQTHPEPWCLHLSYIKPHWPYLAPAPYHQLYGPEDLLPRVRTPEEREAAHPVYRAFMETHVSRTFARDGVREHVLPTYMGLIKQLDDHLGRLFAFLKEQGLLDTTLIVFTSDHGDYLGDHWLGEKDWFHEPSVRIPLICYDPSAEADATRGTTCTTPVEAIDLIPTFLDAIGAEIPRHRLEGQSLLPVLRSGPQALLKGVVFSEYDYTVTPMAPALGVAPEEARVFMVATERWKYLHAPGFRPLLYDLQEDPDELHDLGSSPAHTTVLAEMKDQLLEWSLRPTQRVTRSADELVARRGRSLQLGIRIGFWEEGEDPDAPGLESD